MSDFGPEKEREGGPAAIFQHDHPPVLNVNQEADKNRSLGQRVADRVASIVGGWPFIITQSILLCIWIGLNVYLTLHWKDVAFDPYPFILLNLALSFQAAYTGPIVMMSQNRQAEKDRLAAQSDYDCNVKAEEEIRILMEHLVYQDERLARQDEMLVRMLQQLEEMKANSREEAP
jgi:uncharacterized membrane protein